MLICNARKLEAHVMAILPITFTHGTSGSFSMEATVLFILKRYRLWELVESGRQEVVFAATMDGAELSWKVSQVVAGIKLTNERPNK